MLSPDVQDVVSPLGEEKSPMMEKHVVFLEEEMPGENQVESRAYSEREEEEKKLYTFAQNALSNEEE